MTKIYGILGGRRRVGTFAPGGSHVCDVGGEVNNQPSGDDDAGGGKGKFASGVVQDVGCSCGWTNRSSWLSWARCYDDAWPVNRRILVVNVMVASSTMTKVFCHRMIPHKRWLQQVVVGVGDTQNLLQKES